jgi:glycerol-3-phosphate acyltransferase PlsY
MPTWLPWGGLLAAYVLGSTPVAFITGKAFKGVDLRRVGSGNLGATNVYRSLGAPAAVVVFLLDTLKGLVPAVWFGPLFGAPVGDAWPIAFGLAAIAGHVRPYAGLFKGGGKGVATAGGVFAGLAPIPYVAAVSVFVAAVAATRIVSVGSMAGSVSLALASLVLLGGRSHLTWAAMAVCIFVFWTHRSNLRRLLRGEEPRLGRPGAAR